MDVDFVHMESPKSKGKGKDKGKGKPKGKGKGKGKHNEKRKECWERQVDSRNIPRNVQKLWQDGTHIERVLGERRRSRETSET